nr:PD-(D/E)XK nuclease family transposase [uncultured Mediterraneibacter sp.]
MKNKLQQYFPMIRTEGEVLKELRENKRLWETFCGWEEKYQKEYLDICTGVKGVKLLYDTYFKAIMNPDTRPERLNDFLSEILGKKIKILKVLPNESAKIAAESSLLIMDIVVQFEDGSIANVEVQKVGYLFSGQRSACYSSDLLLRQYKRVRLELGKSFTYKEIKKVYTIVLFEKSNAAFTKFSKEQYIHRFEQKSDTGVKMDLLQEYTFICLDIFNDTIHNEGRKIESRLEEWLVFLSQDDPDMIINLLNCNPEFKKIYEEVYTICLNMERMMSMFSKELEILDRNTVKLMVDEMIEEYTKMTEEHAKKMEALDEVGRQMEAKQEKLKADEEKLKADEEKLKADKEKLKARKEKLETDVAIQKERAETAEAEVEYLRKQLAELQKSNK